MADGLRCENCGQALLATDAVCWQCNWPVKDGAATAVAPSVASASHTTRSTDEINLTAVAIYAILTLLTLLTLLIVFDALSRYPLA